MKDYYKDFIKILRNNKFIVDEQIVTKENYIRFASKFLYGHLYKDKIYIDIGVHFGNYKYCPIALTIPKTKKQSNYLMTYLKEILSNSWRGDEYRSDYFYTYSELFKYMREIGYEK